MKRLAATLSVAAAIAVAFTACSKKRDISAQMAALEKTFPGLSAAVAAQAPATVQPATDDPKACVFAAFCAAKRNDYAAAVILLRRSVRLPGLTPEQLMAVSGIRKAWMSDLSARAGLEDQNAKTALVAIAEAN